MPNPEPHVSAMLSLLSSAILVANPVAHFDTTKGKFSAEIYLDRVPITASNFIDLCQSGFYNGIHFHRVIPGFMVQGGGYDTEFTKKPTKPPVDNEADNGLKNTRGTVAMARTSDPHSATAQFFVNHADNEFLNHTAKDARGWGYTVFGSVSDGMDVVDAIASLETGSKGPFSKDAPQQDVVIDSVERI